VADDAGVPTDPMSSQAFPVPSAVGHTRRRPQHRAGRPTF